MLPLYVIIVTAPYVCSQLLFPKDGNKCSNEIDSLKLQIYHYESDQKQLQTKLNKTIHDYELLKATVAILANRVGIAEADPSEYFGGQGGLPFSDYNIVEGRDITAISLVCSSQRVHSIRVKYGTTWGTEHGNIQTNCNHWLGFDRTVHQYNMSSNEYITSIKGTNSVDIVDSIISLIIYTNQRVLSICGDPNGSGREIVANGTRLLYISGRSGCLLDGLQPHWSIF